MNRIMIGTMNETYKIFSKKKFVILFLISLVVTALSTIMNLLTVRNLGAPLINNANLPITVLNFMSTITIPLFIIMITGDMFAGEFSDKSIVMFLVRPITRNKLYISKILAIGISIICVLLGTFAISFMASLIGSNVRECFSNLPTNLSAYISATIPMMLIAIIAAFVSQFTKSSSFTLVIMILGSILMSSMPIISSQIVPFLPTTYLNWYQNFYGKFNLLTTINELSYILAYGIIFMFGGAYLFQQKDMG
ncbi:UNVERIFIED_CONTAM: ABC-2 type transport system permease protein [Acetivibrio alkalicellulosi]